MTKEEIIEMANQAKLPHDYVRGAPMWLDKLEQFAKLVAEKEREECAKIAQNKISKTWSAPQSPKEWWELASQTIAIEIRERGK